MGERIGSIPIALQASSYLQDWHPWAGVAAARKGPTWTSVCLPMLLLLPTSAGSGKQTFERRTVLLDVRETHVPMHQPTGYPPSQRRDQNSRIGIYGIVPSQMNRAE
jgi:hypothetical protein